MTTLYRSVVLAVIGLGAALGLGAGAPWLDDMDVPVARQVPLLTRVLSFDRSLEGAAPLVVAVVYQDQNRASRQARDAFARALAARPATVHGRPVRLVSVEMGPSLAGRLRRAGADVAYVTPVRGASVRSVAREAGSAGVLTLTGVRSYVGSGVAVGVGLRDGRPEILLNRRAAEASGADLSSRLLQLATIVND